jgi:hypothetical protein
MTVRELIELLSKEDPELVVYHQTSMFDEIILEEQDYYSETGS